MRIILTGQIKEIIAFCQEKNLAIELAGSLPENDMLTPIERERYKKRYSQLQPYCPEAFAMLCDTTSLKEAKLLCRELDKIEDRLSEVQTSQLAFSSVPHWDSSPAEYSRWEKFKERYGMQLEMLLMVTVFWIGWIIIQCVFWYLCGMPLYVQ